MAVPGGSEGMAIRCVGCGRLSRDEARCEWCEAEIPVEARQMAAARGLTRDRAHRSPAATASPAGARREHGPRAGTRALPEDDLATAPLTPEGVSRAETAHAAAPVAGQTEAEDRESEALEAVAPAIAAGPDRETRIIALLILVQFVLTLYLGHQSFWWSLTGWLWLLVLYGVRERAAWSLALPLVLFTLDVSLPLFGIGPRQRAGFALLAPMDMVLYVLRLGIWYLIWCLRDELA
jgi:hypothetical protein